MRKIVNIRVAEVTRLRENTVPRILANSASAGYGYDELGNIALYSLLDGKYINTLKGHKKLVLCSSITPDGNILASGSEDETVRLWSLPDGKHIRTLKGHNSWINCLSITPNGRTRPLEEALGELENRTYTVEYYEQSLSISQHEMLRRK